MTELTLMPAACYPVYPAIAARGKLAPGGAFVDAGGAWVFRHEPSLDPARRQIFHQHELVRIGEPEVVLSWRDEWAQRGMELLRALGLAAELDNANDPFFGRRGRMLSANQRDERLKLELLVQIAGPEPTALASFNHHRDHFGETYGIELADGGIAHTACLGFGHERIVLALLRTHGLNPDGWSAAVRAELWRP
jgi:seryl-tRNA synthetase